MSGGVRLEMIDYAALQGGGPFFTVFYTVYSRSPDICRDTEIVNLSPCRW